MVDRDLTDRSSVRELAKRIGSRPPQPVKMTGSSTPGGRDRDTRITGLPMPIGTEGQVVTVVLISGDLVPGWADPSIISALDDVGDVVITSIANRDVLVWDTATGKWINIQLPRDLDGLNDVTLTGLADKDILSYNSGLGVFRNEPRWNLVSIPDVLLTSLANGDTLIWNTGLGKWVNAQPDTSSGDFSTLNFVIDGGGSAITTGIKGDLVVDYSGTITTWTALADQSGSIVVDIWKDTYANYPPTIADTITGAEKPTISAATKGQDTSLNSGSGWAVTAGDVLRFNVDSVATIQRATIALKISRS